MSGQEDFASLVDVLITCVGIIDVVSLISFIINRKSDGKTSTVANNNDKRSPLKTSDKSKNPDLARSVPHVLVDGIAPPQLEDDVIDSLVSKVNELESKVAELEIKSRESSMERFVEIERYRRSRSPSPFPITSSKVDESSSYDDETTTSSSDSRASSVRRPLSLIKRDDDFRKTKRSHEPREEELMDFTKLEKEEAENMDDFVPISYTGHNQPESSTLILEHNEIESSPEPGMSSMVEKPWCDIKKDAAEIRKQEKKDQLRRSLSIDEQPTAEAMATETLQTISSTNVNENFIKRERNVLQQNSKILVKQAHISSEIQNEETISELEVPTTPFVDIVTDPLTMQADFSQFEVPSSVSRTLENADQVEAFADPEVKQTVSTDVRLSVCSLPHIYFMLLG